MHRFPIVASIVWLDTAWVCRCLSRILLLLVAIELITMPITQHLWSWDQFLHGGHDFELSLLMVVTCLCFLLLRTQHCRQILGLLLAIGTLLLLILQQRERVRLIRFGQLGANADDPLLSSSVSPRSLPLLI